MCVNTQDPFSFYARTSTPPMSLGCRQHCSLSAPPPKASSNRKFDASPPRGVQRFTRAHRVARQRFTRAHRVARSALREPTAWRGSALREPTAWRGSALREPTAWRGSALREPTAWRGSALRGLKFGPKDF
jgi:hypothetical protein